MAILRCNNIKPEYNATLFKIKKTPGDLRRIKASYGITQRPIPEGYYMTRKAPKKENFLVKFIRRSVEEFNGIREAMKPDMP